MPGYNDEAFPSYHDPAAGERPSLPNPPPFQPQDSTEPYTTRNSRLEDNAQTQRHHRVMFSPPVHQDSGFDEYMTESLELNDALPNSRLSDLHPASNRLPTLTTTMELPNDEYSRLQSLTQHADSFTEPAGLTHSRDIQTPQSPPTPATPFSYHTPLTSPNDVRPGQGIPDRYLHVGKAGPDPDRPDSKYCPDPTAPHDSLS